MVSQSVAGYDSIVSPRSKITYDRNPMKLIKADGTPGNHHRRNSAGNNRCSDHIQQYRRRSDRPQPKNRPAFRQRRSNSKIQRRFDASTDRGYHKNIQATRALHKKHATVTRSVPKNRRPNKKTEVKYIHRRRTRP